jgi:hypothetical protein
MIGKSTIFDDFTANLFLYEWGRQFGFLVPLTFRLTRNGRPTHVARQLLRRAFARGELIDSVEKETSQCRRRQ